MIVQAGGNMIKKIVMKNLICSGCAAKIEKALPELDYIQSASFNFANQTMLLEVNENYEDEQAIIEIKRIVDSIESGVETMPYESRHSIEKINFFKTYRLVFIGVLVFIIGFVFNQFDWMLTPRLNPFYWLGYFLISNKIMLNTYKGIKRKEIFNENMLMFIATLAAMFIEKPIEAVLVIVFYSVGEHLQHKAVDKSKNEVSALLDLHIEYANVYDENHHLVIKDPLAIQEGDILVVKNGEKVPVDGVITKGRTQLNTSALTGESRLQSAGIGDTILSGNINMGSIIEVEAKKEYNESTIARIIDLIENSTNKKSKTENFITKFARYYTPFVTIAALIMVTLPTIFNPEMFEEYVFRAATFLVISCPCALVLSIPLSYFAGIGASAKQGILFKGSNFLDMMNEVDVIGIDKTGTLTHGNFEVDGFTSLETLRIAASIEQYSNHPIAKSIVHAYKGDLFDYQQVTEIPGFGLKGETEHGDILVGSRQLLINEGVEVKDPRDIAGTNVYVSKYGNYIGRVIIKDQIKASSIKAIKNLLKRFRITMLTGDNPDTASEVAYQVGGIDYRHSLLPEDKMNEFENIPSQKQKMFVGDGINDAPLLNSADIGVAMGNGSELAIDVADVIIMDDDLATLEKAFNISRRTRRIVYQNIILSLGVKFSFLALATVGKTSMLMAIFADVGITLIAVLNSLRLIYGKNVKKK